MSVVEELLRSENDGSISFGNYELPEKKKVENFKHEGNLLKVKTFKDITKLECNDDFVYESVPGTAVSEFKESEKGISFSVEGPEDAQITLGLDENEEYTVFINDANSGKVKTNVGGKLSISVELAGAGSVSVRVER